jgi:hypothetical protein
MNNYDILQTYKSKEKAIRGLINLNYLELCAFVLITRRCYNGQLEDNEIGMSCSSYRRDEERLKVLIVKPEERDHLKDTDVNGRIILKLI